MSKIDGESTLNKIKYFHKYCKDKKASILEIGPGFGEFVSKVQRFNKDVSVIEDSKSYAKFLKTIKNEKWFKKFDTI